MRHSRYIAVLCAGVFSLLALPLHALSLPQCQEIDITEYATYTKAELINEYCEQSVAGEKHYAQAVSYREASFDARDNGVHRHSQMMLEISMPYTESGRCASENTRKAGHALRQYHGTEAQDFTCESDRE